MPRLILGALLALGLAAPAAAWTLEKRQDWAVASETDGNYTVTIMCRRGSDHLQFSYLDRDLRGVDPTGTSLDQIKSVMLWVKLADGRTDRWPVSVFSEGPSLSGQIAFSSQTLELFQNAESISVTGTNPHHETMFEAGAQGTGAARIAFQERCGI